MPDNFRGIGGSAEWQEVQLVAIDRSAPDRREFSIPRDGMHRHHHRVRGIADTKSIPDAEWAARTSAISRPIPRRGGNSDNFWYQSVRSRD